MKFQIEAPPEDLSEKSRNYLRRQFTAVDAAIAKDPILSPSDKYIPSVQKEGSLVYFTAALPGTPITAVGLYFVDTHGFHRIVPLDPDDADVAAKVHTHHASEVLGLMEALQGIDSRLSAIETAIGGINVRLDVIESKIP